MRAERERAAGVDPCDRAAAGAHFLDVDDRDAQRPPVDVVLVGRPYEPVVDDRALRRRPAHVERDQAIEAEHAREARAPDGARRRPGFDRVHGLAARGLERERAAVGLRDEHLAGETAAGQPLPELTEIASDDRLQVRVHDHGTRALVLTPLLGEAMGDGHGDIGQRLRQDLGGALLVRGIAIREEEDERDGLHAVVREALRGGAYRTFVERYQNVALGIEPLRHLQAAPARHEWRRPPIEHVVHPQEIAAADLEDVAEAFGRHQPRARALAFEERVDADGRAVDDETAVLELDARLVDAVEHTLEERVRRAQRLAVDDGARGLVERHEIREGAANVDADP